MILNLFYNFDVLAILNWAPLMLYLIHALKPLYSILILIKLTASPHWSFNNNIRDT